MPEERKLLKVHDPTNVMPPKYYVPENICSFQQKGDEVVVRMSNGESFSVPMTAEDFITKAFGTPKDE